MEVRAHVLISGRVQGVFFRSETKLLARRLNVTGWIRNLGDGEVEAVFEGNETNVTQLVDFCKKRAIGSKSSQRACCMGDLHRRIWQF